MSRQDLARRHDRFAEVSPEVGRFDETAFAEALRAEPGAAVALLAELTTATDELLRERARRLAGRILLDLGRTGAARRTGAGKLHTVVADRGGDLDLDRSIDAIATATAEGRTAALDELVARDWRRPDLAVCLLVDASGSMSGDRLAAAALTAAACAWRAPVEFAVLSFARQVRVHRGLQASVGPEHLVSEMLTLRGHGVTAVATALHAAADQLAGARAARRVTVLLSDCRATDDVDPVPAATGIDELLLLAPADDADEAAAFAAATGARLGVMASAADAPAALHDLLSRR